MNPRTRQTLNIVEIRKLQTKISRKDERASAMTTLTGGLVDSAVLLAANLLDLLFVKAPASGVVDQLVVAQILLVQTFSVQNVGVKAAVTIRFKCVEE